MSASHRPRQEPPATPDPVGLSRAEALALRLAEELEASGATAVAKCLRDHVADRLRYRAWLASRGATGSTGGDS